MTLPKWRAHLIGLFGSDETPRALLRTADGDILAVRIGDTVEKSTVVAIDAEKVVVAKGKRSDILRMTEPEPNNVAA